MVFDVILNPNNFDVFVYMAKDDLRQVFRWRRFTDVDDDKIEEEIEKIKKEKPFLKRHIAPSLLNIATHGFGTEFIDIKDEKLNARIKDELLRILKEEKEKKDYFLQNYLYFIERLNSRRRRRNRG